MSKFYPVGGSGSGISSSDVTITKNDVPVSKRALTSDSNDEVVAGLLEERAASYAGTNSLDDANKRVVISIPKRALYESGSKVYASYHDVATSIGLTSNKLANGNSVLGVIGTYTGLGDAVAENVLKGKTFSTSSLSNAVGTLEIQSIVNFNLSLYASETVLGAWQNPAKGPYSGVRIVFRTDRYPNDPTDGTVAYEGNGISFTKKLPAGVKHYFVAFSYVTTNYGRLYAEIKPRTEFTTSTIQGRQTFTSNGVFTVPEGVRSVQVFLVGGGGGGAYTGGSSRNYRFGSGGGGGYTKTETISVTPGQQIAVVVGSGGSGGPNNANRNGQSGGGSGFGNIWVSGGQPANDNSGNYPGNGGSGGGRGAYQSSTDYAGGNGGADGSDGGACYNAMNGQASSYNKGGVGQHTTTKDWDGTLYAGGGAGGGSDMNMLHYGYPGAGGGGSVSSNGTTNTGGGGGGARGASGSGGNGGSGIVIVRWGY